MKTEKRNSFGKKFGITVLCGLLCGLLTAGGLAGYAYYCHRKEQKSIDEAKNKMEAVQQKQEGSQVTEELTGLSENRESSVYDVSVVWDNVSPAMVVIDTKIVSSYATIFGQ